MKHNLFSRIVTGLSLLVAVLALSACSFFQGESVDGEWTSSSLSTERYEEIVNGMDGGAFTYSDHNFQEILTQSEVRLNIKDDKAVFEFQLVVDEEAFFTAMKDEQDAAIRQAVADLGLNYDELPADQQALFNESKQSDEQIREFVQTAIEDLATGFSGTYSAEKGRVSAVLFEANVDRGAEVFEITQVNPAYDRGGLAQGEAYRYSYKDGKLTLEGETDEDDLVFEKKK